MNTSMALLVALAFSAQSVAENRMIAYADSVTVKIFRIDEPGTASGVVIGERAVGHGCSVLVGTARHVVDPGPDGGMTLALERWDGPRAFRFLGTVTGDAAVAEFWLPESCDSNKYQVAPVSHGKAIRGQKVFGSGYPEGYSFFSWGHVSVPKEYAPSKRDMSFFLLVIIPAAPGNSGGPLFDLEGQVLGVLSGGFPTAPMLGFYATADQLRDAARGLPEWDI